MIRAFIGVRIAPETMGKIAEAVIQLKQRVSGIRWIAQENVHLTLKFLGQIDETRIEPIGQALQDALRPFSRFTINAKGLGVFPEIKRPQVLWVGLTGDSLSPLASAIDNALEPLGFAKETRAFRPHLSIGRWRRFRGSSARLGNEIERWKDYEFGESSVAEVVLFQSVLRPEGALYRALQVVTLR